MKWISEENSFSYHLWEQLYPGTTRVYISKKGNSWQTKVMMALKSIFEKPCVFFGITKSSMDEGSYLQTHKWLKTAASPKVYQNTCKYTESLSCSCLHSLQDADRSEESKQDCVADSGSSLAAVYSLYKSWEETSRIYQDLISPDMVLNFSTVLMWRKVIEDSLFSGPVLIFSTS